ncbi:hypothetical protein [Corynebacterium pseudotuberculosis]|uniref:hypothetical protein n=1 Tax=Corynebacterium pseudotuberculosis TaxID=1719 RepID=UPI0001DD4988|nr:hypothetical protein [Corynebacterium pseudotuberculosis]MEA1025076.1 hypothetical protein [Corynebacterium pseudotuberculosis]MEB3090308.1 hypothetical protein [Corynebacterium pseudotuberculosis]MEB3092314.1 hypothetical protein [Corynebacterium pseudotuberculosis]MEB3152352.1 hypothetical protein [Corynebacterium pseudotuberculosis]MEB3153937.1 hypothetical protein [Corynebacterium pseudotuberculosis]
MMLELGINNDYLQKSIKELDEIRKFSKQIQNEILKANISGAYSPLIGLDQIGANHGIVLKGGVGSASAVL